MKNHSQNFEEEVNYILGYYKKGNMTNIRWATGITTESKSNYLNEDGLRAIMEKQAKSSLDNRNKQKRRINIYLLLVILSLALIITLSVQISLGVIDIINVFALIFPIVSSMYTSYELVNNIKKYKDIEKNEIYLTNKELFNDNDKVLSVMPHLKQSTKIKIKTCENENVIDINKIDYLSVKELKEIREYIMKNDIQNSKHYQKNYKKTF